MPRIGLCPGLDEPPCCARPQCLRAAAVFARGANNSYGKVEERLIRGFPGRGLRERQRTAKQ